MREYAYAKRTARLLFSSEICRDDVVSALFYAVEVSLRLILSTRYLRYAYPAAHYISNDNDALSSIAIALFRIASAMRQESQGSRGVRFVPLFSRSLEIVIDRRIIVRFDILRTEDTECLENVRGENPRRTRVVRARIPFPIAEKTRIRGLAFADRE